MSASQTQLEEAAPESSVECQSENRLPENSISSSAKTLAPALPHAVVKPQTPSLFKLQQQQQPKQYVINSVAMHVKTTTAGVISGGTLHRAKSAQVRGVHPCCWKSQCPKSNSGRVNVMLIGRLNRLVGL